MKLRHYAILPILALTACLCLIDDHLMTPIDYVYAQEEEAYIMESDDTIIINDFIHMIYHDMPDKKTLESVKHIIDQEGVVQLDELNIFPNVETLTLSAKLNEVVSYKRDYDILAKLSKIEIDPKNPKYKSINGAIYSKSGDKLIYYPMCANPEATVADGTRIIGKEAFKNVPITSVILPEGIVILEENAFNGTQLHKISLPASFRVQSKDTFINTPLQEVEISQNNISLCSYDGAVYNKALTYLYYWPEAKKEIDLRFPDTLTYLDCNYIKKFDQAKTITIPKEMTTICNTGSNRLEKVTLASGNQTFHLFDGVLYSSTEEELRLYPNENPDTEIELSPSLKRLPMDLFYNENSTKTLMLPASLQEFKGEAKLAQMRLGGFTHLSKLTLDPSNENYVLEDGVLYNKEKTALIWFPIDLEVKDVVIPESVIEIKNEQLAKQNHMESLSIPDQCSLCEKAIWKYRDTGSLFDLWIGLDCPNLTQFKLSKNQLYYTVIDGVLFSKNMQTLYCYPGGKKDKTYKMPDAVTYAPFGNANPYLETLTVSRHAYSVGERITRDYKRYGNGLLHYSALKEILVDEKNEHLKSIDGVLYSFYVKTTEMIAYPAAKQDSDLHLATNLWSIHNPEYLKHNKNLKRIYVNAASTYNKIVGSKIVFTHDQSIDCSNLKLISQ